MTTHTLTVKDTSHSYKELQFTSTEHRINGEMLVTYIKGDPCTYFESDDDLYQAAYDWSQSVDYCSDGDYISMNGERLFYMNDYHLERVPGSLKPDYYIASIIKHLDDYTALVYMKHMNARHTLGSLRELVKTPNLNEKVAEAKRQIQCEQHDGKHPVKVVTRYVLTDEPLTSPTGFSPAELVFSLNNVFIQTDRLPGTTNLKVYDMVQVAGI